MRAADFSTLSFFPACPSRCMECVSVGRCRICASGMFVRNGQCTPDCGHGYYADRKTRECQGSTIRFLTWIILLKNKSSFVWFDWAFSHVYFHTTVTFSPILPLRSTPNVKNWSSNILPVFIKTLDDIFLSVRFTKQTLMLHLSTSTAHFWSPSVAWPLWTQHSCQSKTQTANQRACCCSCYSLQVTAS